MHTYLYAFLVWSILASLCTSLVEAYECSKDEIMAMIRRGFTKAEIDSVCQEVPISSGQEQLMDVLSGTWQVSAQSNAGSSLEHWEIKFPNNNLEVIVFHEAVPGIPLPGDYRNRLEVSKVRMVGQKLSFALKRGPSWTAEYSLEVIGPERIEGLYSSTDTLLSDMGAIQGTVGSLRDKGRVIMIKQSR